jgi:hypothetical protein
MVELEFFPVESIRKVVLSKILKNFSPRSAFFTVSVRGKRFIKFFFKFLNFPGKNVKVF